MTSLPFLTAGTLRESDGTSVTTMPCSVWAASGSNTDVGRQYDHEGQSPLGTFSAVAAPNRILEVNGVRYRIVGAVLFAFLPHVSLRLREMKTASSA